GGGGAGWRNKRRRARVYRGEHQAHCCNGGSGQAQPPEESLMGTTDRIWSALTSMIKLEDRVTRQAEALKSQQAKIEDLTARVIRLESHLELLVGAAIVKKLKSG